MADEREERIHSLYVEVATMKMRTFLAEPAVVEMIRRALASAREHGMSEAETKVALLAGLYTAVDDPQLERFGRAMGLSAEAIREVHQVLCEQAAEKVFQDL